MVWVLDGLLIALTCLYGLVVAIYPIAALKGQTQMSLGSRNITWSDFERLVRYSHL